ncbi:hypothetical protein [Actinomadura oligospora]|uniref:hypothetical protein n=1 Tax=Actinomadura oligospora TaxID=111804 RepID=UPI0004B21AA2|nr:hypothetical protein [Actinomadura oligospora]
MSSTLRMMAVTGAMAAGTITPLLAVASAHAESAPVPQPRVSAASVADGTALAGADARTVGAKALRCVSTTGSIACFEPSGDKVYVKDTKKDHYSAVAIWKTSYGRKGGCRNALGYGKWAVCDYNMKEGRRIHWQALRYDGNTHRYIRPVSRMGTANI